MSIEELSKKLDGIEKLLKRSLEQNSPRSIGKQKPFLVKAIDVFELTIWYDSNKLKQAVRKNHIVQIRTKKKGTEKTEIFYDLNSVADIFKKLNNTTAQAIS